MYHLRSIGSAFVSAVGVWAMKASIAIVVGMILRCAQLWNPMMVGNFSIPIPVGEAGPTEDSSAGQTGDVDSSSEPGNVDSRNAKGKPPLVFLYEWHTVPVQVVPISIAAVIVMFLAIGTLWLSIFGGYVISLLVTNLKLTIRNDIVV